jgi:RNA polymerase sigma factor (sigma-70 family)
MENDIKDYRITIKARNNRLLKAIENCGGTPGQKWCDANGLGYAKVNDLINMKSGPLKLDGSLFDDAAKLCDILDKLPEDLWSNEQLYPLERNFSDMEMDYAQVVSLLQEPYYLQDFSEIEEEQTKTLVDGVLETLTCKEQKVINLRFYQNLTYEESGHQLGVSGHRIRQIEARALRRLRHPSRCAVLTDCIDLPEEQNLYIKKSAKEYIENL